MENKFSMDSLYRTGVTYLSREEENKAILKAVERTRTSPVHSSMSVQDTDYESLAFLQLVRQLINNWLALGDVDQRFLPF